MFPPFRISLRFSIRKSSNVSSQTMNLHDKCNQKRALKNGAYNLFFLQKNSKNEPQHYIKFVKHHSGDHFWRHLGRGPNLVPKVFPMAFGHNVQRFGMLCWWMFDDLGTIFRVFFPKHFRIIRQKIRIDHDRRTPFPLLNDSKIDKKSIKNRFRNRSRIQPPSPF